MFDVFPVFGWITVILAVAIVIATRSSDRARDARQAANVSLMWLLPAAILSWLLLAARDGELVKTHVVLFGIELLLAVFIVRRYASWAVLPFLFALVCLVWSGGIALHESQREHSYRVGEEFRPPMGATQASVSQSFKRPQVALALDRAQQFAASDSLKEFTCGASVPPLRMSIRLVPEGEYSERRVELTYLPDLHKMDDYACLERGIDYLFDETVREIDSGPPINYHYKNPLTGAPLYTGEWDRTQKPFCRCDLQHSGREWVAYSEKAAAELR